LRTNIIFKTIVDKRMKLRQKMQKMQKVCKN